MGIIQLLDTTTTNKIAAGEVVANPASVVKELVENSLDAGSTRISVETCEGGISSIKVADNGSGIAPEDLETAFMRHATSKIRGFGDLDTVTTMGFRGEALASIAAVSRVTVTSRTQGSNEGRRINVAGGKTDNSQPVGCAPGTTIEVADLFYNVPARRKFLKSVGRETAGINETVARLALGNPHAAIKLKNDGRLVFETYGNNDLLAAAAAVLGKDIGEHLIPVDSSSEGWTVRGFVSVPFFTRSTRKSQYFYVNNRWVANPSMRYALDHAYRTLIPRGRYPIAVLFLETARPLIDVNVDPTKNTVRISGEKTVLDLLVAGVRASLSENRRAKGVVLSSPSSTSPRTGLDRISPSSELLPHFNHQGDNGAHQNGQMGPGSSRAGDYRPDERGRFGAGGLVFEDADSYPGESEGNQPPAEPSPGQPVGETGEEATMPFRILAQLAGSYILYERNRNLYIVDQHAAHERIRYETLLNAPSRQARQLVIPQTVSLTPHQIGLVEQLSEELAGAGFQFESFGGSCVVLREVPIELSFSNPEAAFAELLELTENNIGTFKDLRNAFMFSLACKTAVKAGQILSLEEMQAIIQGLSRCREPLTCPHGRPTTICISERKLLKEFKRV